MRICQVEKEKFFVPGEKKRQKGGALDVAFFRERAILSWNKQLSRDRKHG